MSGLYIHIPFCHCKCAYCDFYSTPQQRYISEYVAAIPEELDIRIDELPKDEHITTLYIGGGTPSMLPLPLLRRLVERLGARVDLSHIEEFTVEANPEDLSVEWLQEVKRMGVNRVSMGIQSFEDNELKLISRRHDSATARRALELLASSGLNFSCDLIYGLPEQSLDSWTRSLYNLLSYRPPHFSAYLLMLEPGTRLYAMLQAGKLTETPDHLVEQMYATLCQAAADNGYAHYEISNFSQPGFESRHNLSYWRDVPYLGLGVSACSFDGLLRRRTPVSIPAYLSSVRSGVTPSEVEEETDTERLNDYILTSLRTAEGLSMTHVALRFGTQIAETLAGKLDPLIRRGLVDTRRCPQTYTIIGVNIPERNFLISDSIIRPLIF